MDRLTTLLRRAKQVYRAEGLVTLMRRGLAFVQYHLLEYRTYYLYAARMEEALRVLGDDPVVPGVDGLTVRVVSSNHEADELEAQGFEFRSQASDAVERLDSGAAAFCVFVGNELASIGWAALSQEAMDSLDEPPYRVHFADHESCTGRYWTNPKYRGEGLAPYASSIAFKFLHDRGIRVNRTAMRKGNISSMRATERAGFKAYGEGRYLRVLWWRSWKEKPLSQ